MAVQKALENKKKDFCILGCIALLATILRWLFLRQMELPSFDPWRHLALVQNLRQGLGFILFDGQPYIWYGPSWYILCASLPPWIEIQWISAFLSVLSALLMYLFLRSPAMGLGLWASAAGALMMAAFGPLITFTCHYGSEAFALFLMMAALVLCAQSWGSVAAFLGGAFFGVAVVSRMNFVFNLFLFAPMLTKSPRALSFLCGLALPLSLTYWRNFQAVKSYPYLFTWDGLATRSAEYTPLSILAVQMHASVQEATRTLHKMIMSAPEWMAHWELVLFMVCGVACVLISKRLVLFLAGLLPLVFFLFFDRSLSANFFRICLPLFPVFFIAITMVANRLFHFGHWKFLLAAWALVPLVIFSGVGYLRPHDMYAIEEVTPPPQILSEDAYMVNSGFYQPESLIYRFPHKRFIGMPLQPASFEDFYRNYPQYKFILWHEFSVQDDLLKYLVQNGKFAVIGVANNGHGRQYMLLRSRT
jgi:hypothetical protein